MDMMGYYILDKNNETREVTCEYWSRWFEDVENRRVKETHVGKVMISSIFIGIPHEGGMFETMIREPDKDRIYRYETYKECLKEHGRLVKELEKETKEKL